MKLRKSVREATRKSVCVCCKHTIVAPEIRVCRICVKVRGSK